MRPLATARRSRAKPDNKRIAHAALRKYTDTLIDFARQVCLHCCDMKNNITNAALLAADEPAPFTVFNQASSVPLLLLCDHAGALLPRALGTLGLGASTLQSHLALDIGAAEVTRQLATRFQATAILGNYSRLAIDLNRDLCSTDAFLEFSDGVTIPGNQDLSHAQRQARVQALYQPYHSQVEQQLQRIRAAGAAPTVVSIHSFTPVLDGVFRPWELGVLWNRDPHTAQHFVDALSADGYLVGDNQPYSGKELKGYTVEHHTAGTDVPHVLLEIRQDLLVQPAVLAGIVASLERIVRNLLPQQQNSEQVPCTSPNPDSP